MSRLLIVEDEDEIRTTLAELLRVEGFEVVESASARDALSFLLSARTRPSLILLDLMMPGMSGEAFLEVLGELGLLRDMPVVVMTAKRTCRVPGARRVLAKPFAFETLLAMILELCPMRGTDDGESAHA